MAEPSVKAKAWALFDQLVQSAPLASTNPWVVSGDRVAYAPDFSTLALLLGVPLKLDANSQSGVPALALDVWTAYELRRAGFHPDRVWPRASAPRVLPFDVSALVDSLPTTLRWQVLQRLQRGRSGGTTSASANLLGKNYVKQVDVVMSSWQTGPELMVSTKRMDSSFAKNAANRVEESYGDAKNLSLRHPQAALGFLYCLRSTAFVEEPDTAAWLLDLLAKLGREDEAYDVVGLLVPEYGADSGPEQGEPDEPSPVDVEPAITVEDGGGDEGVLDLDGVVDMPVVRLRHDLVPPELSPTRFFEVLITTVLTNSPVNFHPGARDRLRNPRPDGWT